MFQIPKLCDLQYARYERLKYLFWDMINLLSSLDSNRNLYLLIEELKIFDEYTDY